LGHVARNITESKKTERVLVDTLKASHRRQAEVSALLEASKAVLIHREFSKAARAIFNSCKDLMGASAGYVALLRRDKKKNEVLFLDSGGGFPIPAETSRGGLFLFAVFATKNMQKPVNAQPPARTLQKALQFLYVKRV